MTPSDFFVCAYSVYFYVVGSHQTYDNGFRIGLYGDIRVSGQGQIFDADDITDLHLSDIDHYLIDQGCRVCHIGNLVQILLQNAFCDLFMVYKDNLCNGMNFLVADQCLELDRIDLSGYRVIINIFDQDIVCGSVDIQHNLAAFVVCLQQFLDISFYHLNWNGFFHLSAEYIADNVSFSSESFCLYIQTSLFSF